MQIGETTMKMDRIGSFRWEDPFLLEDELIEEERMIRDTARSYAQGHLAPRVREAFQTEQTDRAIFTEMGELGLLGRHHPRGIRRHRRGLRQLRPCRARGRAGGFGLPIHDVGPGEPRDVPDQRLRVRGAAAQVPAEALFGRMGGLLRADRARRGVRPRRHEDHRPQDRERLCAERHEDVDFQLAHRRCLRRLGQVRGA